MQNCISGQMKRGWSIIHGKNPKKDYDIDISYSSNFSQNSFEPIIKDLKKLAKQF